MYKVAYTYLVNLELDLRASGARCPQVEVGLIALAGPAYRKGILSPPAKVPVAVDIPVC